MSWLYLPEPVAAYSPENFSDGEPSAMSSGISTRSKLSKPGSETATLTMLQSGMTVLVSTGHPGLDWWMSSLRDSRASHSARPEKDYPKTTQEMDGLPSNESLAKYDHTLHIWKMYQVSFLNLISEEYLGNWPRSGTMRNGVLYRQLPLAHRTSGNVCGYLPTPTVAHGSYQRSQGSQVKRYSLYGMAHHNLWPTPRLNTGPSMDKRHLSLDGAVRLYPTPTQSDATKWNNKTVQERKDNHNSVRIGNVAAPGNGGKLNPNWVEWLMGWPIGWTDLKPLAMDKYQQWLEEHTNF